MEVKGFRNKGGMVRWWGLVDFEIHPEFWQWVSFKLYLLFAAPNFILRASDGGDKELLLFLAVFGSKFKGDTGGWRGIKTTISKTGVRYWREVRWLVTGELIGAIKS